MSMAKTSVVLFYQFKNKRVKVCCNGPVLKKVEKIMLVSLIFDRCLSWKSHIEYLVDK